MGRETACGVSVMRCNLFLKGIEPVPVLVSRLFGILVDCLLDRGSLGLVLLVGVLKYIKASNSAAGAV